MHLLPCSLPPCSSQLHHSVIVAVWISRSCSRIFAVLFLLLTGRCVRVRVAVCIVLSRPVAYPPVVVLSYPRVCTCRHARIVVAAEYTYPDLLVNLVACLVLIVCVSLRENARARSAATGTFHAAWWTPFYTVRTRESLWCPR
ncbi:hypothetical protein DAEQUDRAFT_494297 [Daedalea quercina L-15889]|uniref:Uncharacterized protein n=1 Tax=Daedalea quercina L-15889 TaxID=1314783 RepID=A0A165MN71_9APHY|nr:hypothetical protein DAEQUDRAFT_494297 [Daedalea quercina L-15889]